MAFHLPTIPVHFGGWEPDWPALVAAVIGAALGVAVGFAVDHLPSWLTPERTTSSLSDSFGAEFSIGGSIGGWMGGFGEREASTRLSLPIFALLALAGAVATGVAVHRYGYHATGVIAALFCVALVLLAALDFRQRMIPDLFTFPLIWLGLLANLPVAHASFAPIQGAIVGAVLGYLLPWGVSLPTRLLGKEVSGSGDFKLYAAVGAWLGVAALPQVFAVSVITAAIGMIVSRVAGQEPDQPVQAFGPCIAIAAGITMCCGVWLNIPFMTLMGEVL